MGKEGLRKAAVKLAKLIGRKTVVSFLPTLFSLLLAFFPPLFLRLSRSLTKKGVGSEVPNLWECATLNGGSGNLSEWVANGSWPAKYKP